MSDIRQRFAAEMGPGGLEVRGYAQDVMGGDDTPVIAGIGSPYDASTRIQGWDEEWDEIVAPGAWTATISKPDVDVICTFNHNVDNLLGRTSAGTLALDESDAGLLYAAQINKDDPAAMGVHARVARRDLSGSSVWFRVVKDQWEEPSEDNDLEVPLRTILAADLYEVGPVTFPAFPQTTSEAASFRTFGIDRQTLTRMDQSLTAAGITRHQSQAAYAARFLALPPARREDHKTGAALPEPHPDDRRRRLAEESLEWQKFRS
ncbi:MAG: HK97 family phage prohead protease [Anaerovoracaceae bacterium]